MVTAIALAAVLLTIQDRPVVDPVAELAAARTLYASAAYEKALERLARAGQGAGLIDEVDTYRALCLLALDRTSESEHVLEGILARNPRFVLAEDTVSPRLVDVFRAVRARVLPEAARNLFAAARASFDDKKYDAAVAQLRELQLLISPANVPDSAVGLADLRVLSEGFLKLAESLQGPVAPAAATAPPAAPATRAAAAETVYSVLDRDVIAPVEITRPVPGMKTPNGAQPALYQGLVEVVINAEGRVESAVVRKSINAGYDADLVAATALWRFQPATRNGVAVKYRRAYEVILFSR
jgi:TonB family protein